MVFSSVSAYLDLPHWQQEHNHSHQIIQEMNTTTTTTTNTATNPIVLPTQFQNMNNPSNGPPVANPARPMTVSERARLANIPVPEPALKCPRCDSTNTKFCYFNNYSLTQPRHFCKTCRRYWTRGGALRNVPVGGGCRRTRKPTSSKSTPSKQAASSTTTSAANTNGTSSNALHQSLRFLSPPLGQGFLGSADHHHLGLGNDSSLMMSGFGEMNNVYGSSSVVEPWAQLQFMGGLDPATANYGGSFNSCVDDQVVMRGKQISASSLLNHLGPVKMEGSCNNNHDVSKQLLMNMGGGLDDHHHWNNINGNVNACWNEISGFSSSSASNALYLS